MPDGGLVLSAQHQAALQYAAAGCPVFPCQANGKKPATPNGFKNRTTDRAQIDAWWSQTPNFNIAVVPADLDLCVIDLDPKHGGIENWQALTHDRPIPATYTVATPSGGMHLYFRGSLPGTVGKLSEGVDTRGILSYVLAVGSAIDGKPYSLTEGVKECAELPAWVSQTITAPRYGDQATREFVERNQKVPVPEAELVAILRYVDPDCGYDDWYRLIGAIRATRLADVAEDATDARLLEIAQAWSRGDYWSLAPSRWTGDDDTERKFWAMPPKPGGSTFGTLYHAAKAAGYNKPPPRLSDAELFAGVAAPGSTVASADDDRGQVAEGRWPLTHIRDRATALSRPDPQMLVAEIIPDRKLIMPWGDTGCGKTFWSVEIATAVAMRRPAFDKFPIVKPGESGIAVIFAGEDCDFLDKSRLTAIEQHHQRSLQGLVYTVDTAIPINDPSLFNAYRDEMRRLQDIAGKPIDVVLNDTLKRSLGLLKQNDDDTGRRFTMAMEGLIDEFGCTIICNAHQPKSGADGGIAGSGDFTANCPVTPHLVATHVGERIVNITCRFEPKFRVGPTPQPFAVKTVSVPLPSPVAGFASDLVLSAMTAEEEAQRPSPAREARLSEQEECAEIERVCRERGAHDLDTGITTENLALYITGDRRAGESDNDLAKRRHEWKQRLDNGARRPKEHPRLSGYFDKDSRGDGSLRFSKPVRKWFAPRLPDEEARPW